ncbi:MAG TPA: hypothetical protein VER12_11130 [Polyangiaceae bacterium]|nr:hypothetical protein [Polyangiaceae bacterium]
MLARSCEKLPLLAARRRIWEGQRAMDEERLVPVSPRHSVLLSREYLTFIDTPPQRDYVVRTIAKRQVGAMMLMSGDLVIASADTRATFPLAADYPLHFRKSYFPGQMHGDTKDEFENHARAAALIDIPPPIGHTPNTFRSCLLPGIPYSRLSPFGAEPQTANIALAEKLPLASAAGLWRLCEDALTKHVALQAGGLAHGDAELHNLIVCPTPLELLMIDFEGSVDQKSLSEEAWQKRCATDLEPLLREAIFLQCALGKQRGKLAELAAERAGQLLEYPEQFARAIEQRASVGG